jgi:hypothetical protein
LFIQTTAVEQTLVPLATGASWPRAGAPVGEIAATLLTFKIKI